MKLYEIEAVQPSIKKQLPTENKLKGKLRIPLKRNSLKESEENSKKLSSIAAKYPFCIIYKTKNNDPL